MSNSSVRLLEPAITARIHLAIDRIEEEMGVRGAADVYKWWMFMATDVVGELCFADSFRMLEHGQVSAFVPHAR